MQREEERAKQTHALQQAYDQSTRSLANLVTLRIRDIIDDAEFTKQRSELQNEQSKLQERLLSVQNGQQWFEPARLLFSFSNRAVLWYREGEDQRKRKIVRAVGSNLTLKDKKLCIKARKPFSWISEKRNRSKLLRALEEVRTLYNARDPELMGTLTIINELVQIDGLSLDPLPVEV